ncbi:MAG: hypothetical protein RR931_05595 [Mucinivorans sp.]
MIITAGPCSAETREQVLETAKVLSQAGVKIFRAGVWKPRTRPGNFEGVGREALDWLREAKELYGLKIATEINWPSNVQYLVEAGIDIAWLGARTTVNPFLVDEIASELGRTEMEVWVKNPVCPDAELWIGAIERVRRAGAKRIVAIHRGFSQFGVDLYRNTPLWNIPLKVMRDMPTVPMLCDPSHIAGRSEYVRQICYMALQLGFNGLFVESHCSPHSALSDARQQLSTYQATELFAELKRNLPELF